MFYRVSRSLSVILLALLLVSALAVAIARQFLPSVAEYRDSIENLLSEKAGFPISIERLSADWEERYPSFHIEGIKGDTRTASKALDLEFYIDRLDVKLDLIASIFQQAPIFEALSIQAFDVKLYETDGQWVHLSPQTDHRPPDLFLKQIVGLLSLQPSVLFEQGSLELNTEEGKQQRLSPLNFQLQNTKNQHHLYGHLMMALPNGKDSEVEFALESGALEADVLNTPFQAYARVGHLDESLINLKTIKMAVGVKKLDMDGELWAQINQQKIQAVQGRLHLPELTFTNETYGQLSHGYFDFNLQPLASTDFIFEVLDFSVNLNDKAVKLPYSKVVLSQENQQFVLKTAAVKRINLDQITEAFKDQPYLPEALNTALVKLSPEGRVENLSIIWPNQSDWFDFKGEADLNRVGVGDYFGAPSLHQVSGRIQFSALDGAIDLNADDFSMGFPDIFKDTWVYQKATGRISWQVDNGDPEHPPIVTVRSDLINLQNSYLSASGRFSLYLPLDRQEQTELTLLIGMKDADGRQASSYIPAAEVGVSLYEWIDGAIQGGHVNDGMLVLLAGTRHLEDRSAPSVQLYFDVNDGAVKFQPNWPEVQGSDLKVSLDGGNVAISATGGRLLNSDVNHVSVGLVAGSDNLSVQTQLEGDAADIMTLLQGPALSEQVGGGLSGWALSGHHLTDVDLMIPLNSKAKPDIKVNSQLSDGVFSSDQNRIRFAALNGGLSYSSAKGLSSDELITEFLGQPAKVKVETLAKTQTMPSITRVNMSTQIEMRSLQKWSELGLLNVAKGKSRIVGRMDLCGGSPLCNKLIVDSDLKGVELDLPSPFNKSAETSLPLQLVAQLGSDVPVWRYNLGDKLRGVSRLIPEAGRHHITFGGERPEESLETGVWIDGELDRVRFSEVQRFIDQTGLKQEGIVSSDTGLQQLSLIIGEFDLGSIQLQDLSLVVSSASNEQFSTRIGLISEQVTGQIQIPQQSSDPYQVSLKHLYLETGDDDVEKELSTDILETSSWPSVDLDVAALFLDQKPLGNWAMKIHPEANNGLAVKSIVAEMDGFRFEGTSGWEIRNQRAVSFLDSQLSGGDFGNLLEKIGYQGVLESTSTKLENKFAWLGYPWEFKSKHLDGLFKMNISKGRIVEAGNSSNILRIFGILNLNTIIRRLQLNFSDLLEKGVAFDTLQANYLLSNGVAVAQTPLILEGPSANINMTGTINIPDKSLDSKMDVVLPLTSNLPIAAVLLGAPQVAGAVFIIDKLIGDKLERVTTLKYSLKGPWEEPVVNVFKGETKTKETHGFTEGK